MEEENKDRSKINETRKFEIQRLKQIFLKKKKIEKQEIREKQWNKVCFTKAALQF